MRMRLALITSLFAAGAAGCGASKPTVTVPAPPSSILPEVAAIAPTPTTTPPPPVTATKVRTIEGITEYRLGNGMTVLLFPDATQSNVTVNVTYMVGSRHEGYGETGMAHLLEHMMFKGTKKLRDISKLLDEKGASSNASTDYDRTNYFETVPATQDNVDWMLGMEADRMINSTFLEADLASEFSVVRNEFEMGENDPSAVLWERVRATAYLWHNYGKSVIGSRADIEKVPASALRVFYAKFYQPDNAVLVVAGKFDDARTLATIEATFGAIPRPTRALPPTYTVEPVQDGEREVTLRRTGDLHVVGMAWHAVAGTSPDYPAVEAAIDILTRQPSGRLYKKLVETKLAASLSGEASANHDPQVVEIYAELRDGKQLAKVEQILRDEVESLASGKLDPKDLERWRAATTKELDLAMTDSRRLALELSEQIALGDWRMLFAYRAGVEKVTVDDVQRVARKYFVASNATVGRFIPLAPKTPAVRAPLTEAPDVAAIVKDVQGRPDAEVGEAFVATPDTLEERTRRSELKNGIKAAFLPKKTRGGKVVLSLSFHFGDEKTLQNTALVAEMVGAMIGRGTASAAGKKSFQDLEDLQDQLKARIGVDVSAGELSISIETLRDKLPAALDLAAEMVMSPSFPGKELELVRQQQLAALETQLNDPAAIAAQVAAQLANPWPKSDPRATWSTADQIAGIKKIAIGELVAFHKNFIGGGHGELAVVGDFDPAAIGAQVDRLFGAWASKKPYARLAEKAFGTAGQAKSIDTKDKENAQLSIGHDVAIQDSDPDYPAWLVLGQVFGGDSGSRIWQRVREKGGLSYGAWGYTNASAFDPAGEIGAGAIVAPANLAKVRTMILDEYARLVTGGFTAEEVAYAKGAILKTQETSWSSDRTIVASLAGGLERGRTFAYLKDLRARIAAVTPADVERAAKRFVKPDRLLVIDAGDQAKAKAAP
ncbi:MAG: pitrilysin family protein [Proteobacteria bacterium]|nr:pitrilysin family protein [Pseudomonadota bacterium]